VFRALRNLSRLFRIVRILGRHDALILLRVINLGSLAPMLRLVFWPRRTARRQRPGERIAAALQDLGPAFIKFGQTWSTRPDLIGPEIAADLAALRDRLPAFATPLAIATIEKELGKPLSTVFSAFGEPVAAASIAQVHYAVTTDGREVAVKVLRPGIEQRFLRDIDLFFWLADIAERNVPAMRRLKPVAVVQKFADGTIIEMDLTLEAAAADEVAENFTGDPTYQVPAVDWERTSQRVLTLQRVSGIGIGDTTAIAEAGIAPQVIIRNLLWGFLRQVFRDGFFHGDMHPGNLFVDAEGNILAVDFGIMGRLDLQTRRYLADLMLAFLTRDYRRAAEVHFEAGYVPSHKSLDAFAQACRAIGEPVLGRPAHEVSIARLLGQLLRTTETFAMETQPQLLLLQKTMVVAEGVARSLDANVVFWELAQPVIEEWMWETMGPAARLRDALAKGADLARRLPEVVETAERGLAEVSKNGVRLHDDTLRLIAATNRRRDRRIEVLLAAVIGLLLAVLLL
jgi:ubiquinone biosynthesis protein